MPLRESTEAIFSQGDGGQCGGYSRDIDSQSLRFVLDLGDLLSVPAEVQRTECIDRELTSAIDVREPSLGF